MTMSRIAVVMPAYNEADGIEGFLDEIVSTFTSHDLEPVIGVINDSSTDDTAAVVTRYSERSPHSVQIRSNETNMGHGPSSIRAWRLGLEFETDIVVHVDGDGQFDGADIVAVVLAARGMDGAIGVRTQRADPWFRRIVTWSLRQYIRALTRFNIRDANTPLRSYTAGALRQLLDTLPEEPIIPSVYLSVAATASELQTPEVSVASHDRRGDTSAGSTWGRKKLAFLPSRRLITFVVHATKECNHTIRQLSASQTSMRAQ
jgi:dolichol-phosphate mannosyltransferase